MESGYAEDFVKFLVVFFALFAFIHLLDVSLLTSFLAGLEGFLLSSLGFATVVSNSLLTVNSISFLVSVDCSGLVLIVLLFSLFVSTGVGSVRNFVFFSALLFLFNIARLLLTIEVGGVFGFGVMEATHIFLWFVDSGVVFAIWLCVGGFI